MSINLASIPIDIYRLHRDNLPISHGIDIRECSFPFMGKTVHLRQGSALRAAKELFFENEYGAMDVRGKTVLDIGCSDGDTAVYFLLKGANNVIGYDMLAEFTDRFWENMLLNNMENKAEFHLEEASKLGTLLKRHNLKDACLKMDIEGAEQQMTLNASDKELRTFQQIIMEYHQNPEPIRKRLERAGFAVRTDDKKPIMNATRREL